MFDSLQMVMISKLCVHMNLEEAVTFTLFFNPEFPLCTACRNYILVLRVETTRNELKTGSNPLCGRKWWSSSMVTTETDAEHKIKYAFASGTVIKIIL